MTDSRGIGRKLVLCACLSPFLFAAGCRDEREAISTEESFRSFFDVYIERVDARDVAYLLKVHPDLPDEMRDFFLDVTTDMMKHSRAEGLEPEIECREYEVCKVVGTQPDGSWTAQHFILHEGQWQFLAE